jgi:hypothetical protein
MEGISMAELIAVAYPDKNTARDVVQTLSRLQKEHVVELADVAVATKEQDGKVRLVTPPALPAQRAVGRGQQAAAPRGGDCRITSQCSTARLSTACRHLPTAYYLS